MKEDFLKIFTALQDPPVPAQCSTKISTKMVKINAECFSDNELVNRWSTLAKKEDWDEECEMCKMPIMLYKGPCTRKEEFNAFEFGELWKAWSLFREKMKMIRKWQSDQEEKKKMQSDISIGMNEIVDSQNANIVTIIEAIKVKENKTAKLVKPAKVPVWT